MSSWTLNLKSGLKMAVPPTFGSMTTFVLLEQEAWFEPEMSLLPLLLKPGARALDIGANHGVVSLELARCIGQTGHVWAFEPTAAPRGRLLQSRQLNGFEDRITVVPAALAEADGETSFAVHDNSELNSRGGAGQTRETVQLLALDGWLARHAPDVVIDFVKLDAEGDELRVLAGAKDFFARQSPIVMFEFMHGKVVSRPLIDAWRGLGYGLFRWSEELGLLRPFDALRDELDFALNLLAVRPVQQQQLAQRGLLFTAEALAALPPVPSHFRSPAAVAAWCAQPVLHGVSADAAAAGGELYEHALHAAVAAHLDRSLPPAMRWALMADVRDVLKAGADSGASLAPAAWALLVHALFAAGEQGASIKLALQLLACWPQGVDVGMPYFAPSRADMARARSTGHGEWLRQMLGEHVEKHSAHSAYFRPAGLPRMAHLLEHPDHSVDIERRFLLAHALTNRAAPLAHVTLLPHAEHTANPALWAGLMAAMPMAA
jgi:FkbM family methyltransferase